ncbi:MFS transporter [Pedococcus soli]
MSDPRTTTPATSEAALTRQRLGIAATFATQGLLFISVTTRLPRFQDRWDLDELFITGLLLMVVLLAGVGSVLTEPGARRLGSATVLRVAFGLITVGLALVALAPQRPVFVAGLAVYGLGLGAVDAAGNMQAVALEHRWGRTILPSFHGAWTVGGIIGTLVAIAVTNAGLTAGLLPLAAVAALAIGAPLLPHAVSAVGDAPPAVAIDIPWRRIGLLGAAMVLFYTVDTAATTWGPVFLKSAHDAPAWLLPLATLPYLVASGLTRLLGDRAVERFGAVPLVRGGAVAASLGLAVIVFSPTWPVAVVGFTVVGASVAVIAPLSFSAAAVVAGDGVDGEARRARVDAVIARFNQFNYVGGLLGAVLTGAVGQDSLRVGFAVPMVLVLLILPLAGVFRARRT